MHGHTNYKYHCNNYIETNNNDDCDIEYDNYYGGDNFEYRHSDNDDEFYE